MVQTSPDVVECEVRIAAHPDTVFAFFTDAEKMTRWKGTMATLDPRPGGIYRVEVTPGNTAVGEYREIEPYTRIVFTWGWEGAGHPVPPGASTVEVTFTPDGDGTIVHLRHAGLDTAELRTAHGEGWDHFLARLIIAAAGGDAGRDPWLDREMPR